MVILYFLIAIIISLLFYRKTLPQISNMQRFFLLGLRTVSLVIIFILLFNPVLFFFQSKEKKPEVVFLIDKSDSMNLPYEESSKSEYVLPISNELQKLLQKKNYRIMQYFFADGLTGENYSTSFSKTMYELSNRNLLQHAKHIFLISDGWFHDDELSIVQKLSVPIHALLSDKQQTIFDLEVTDITHNTVAYLNETNPIIVSVYAHHYEGKAYVELFDDNRLISKKEVDFSTNSFQQVTFEHTFNYTGLHKLKATITTTEALENYALNNVKSSAIQVVKEKMKALVLTDNLNWDAMFTQRSIRQNNRWDVTFLNQNRNRWMNGKATTTLAENIAKADVVLMIRTERLQFSTSELELIKNFCNQGGGLFYQGFPEIALREILPFQGTILTRDFTAKFSITSTGRKYQTLNISNAQIDLIPPVPYAYVNPTLQSQVLATFLNEENSPAILFQSYGKGKILLLPFLQLWKWQMRQSDNMYAKFINDVVSWISNLNSETFFATTDNLMYRLGDKVSISLTAYDETLSPRFDAAAKVTVKKDDNVVFADYLIRRDTQYTITVSNLTAGDYSYQIADEKTNQQTEGSFTVSAENPENYDLGFNNTLLSYLAAETYGSTFLTVSEVIEKINPVESFTEKLKIELPLYRKWYIISLFIITFCMELFYRKRWGLL
jgi:hypothetical protein